MAAIYDTIREYMSRVQAVYATGETTEHSFRPALQYLFDHITDDVQCVNEPKMVTDVGRPDFVFKRTVGDSLITVGHCEAKDIDKDVTPRAMNDANKAQHKRYINGLPNLIYTNGLDFHFYVEGELKHEVSIADFAVGITPRPERYPEFAQRLQDFARERVQTITSPERLAKLMAGKAVLVKTALFRTLRQDEELRTELGGQYTAFKDQLIHDLTPEGFADIYAETVAYGMFAARLHDQTPEDFSREEALSLLPKSNPFLRKLFEFIARQDLDPRIKSDIDELAEIFQATNLQNLFEGFGSFTQRNDPFIHFYETFLAEYNPKKRKARGVWYTPEPVVNFIVRAVDDVLRTEFGLADGLADTSRIIHEVDTGQTRTTRSGKTVPIKEKREMHRVQVLDPATGTGTFLAEVIRLVGDRVKGIAPGKWSGYVENDLIPRLHGFELLMASYAMCHMKLDMMLTDLGYKPKAAPDRLSVWLTNSLEKPDEEVRDLFLGIGRALNQEARGAISVKRDKPIMCVIGNPPYSGHSSNKGEWIEGLIAAYKTSPRLQKPAQAKWLSDDYVKFIRMSEEMISNNGEGILAFITNHSYLDNPTFADMRTHLSSTFDKIWLLDLHGNTTKKEVAPDGSKDTNIFDIKQGVAIFIGVKTSTAPAKPACIFRADIYGTREVKNRYLLDSTILDRNFQKLNIEQGFEKTDLVLKAAYGRGICIEGLFSLNGRPAPGLATQHDQFAVSMSRKSSIEKVKKLISSVSEEDANKHFSLCGQSQWNYQNAKNNLSQMDWEADYSRYYYRPFDLRHTIFNRHVTVHRRLRVMQHMIGTNTALIVTKNSGASGSPVFSEVTVSPTISDLNLFRRGGAYVLPLYLYPEPDALDQTRRVNMDPKIRASIEDAAEHPEHGRPDEVAIFDYIYGVLHCPAYRETYAEFLKIDFPRVPYPSSPDAFWDISVKGTALRRLHLMELDAIGETPFLLHGDDVEHGDAKGTYVMKGFPKFQPSESDPHIGTVFINKNQGFHDVPHLSWEFYIGGYQPAQKWLKDRRGRELSFDDVRHYARIIKILSETDRIMRTIEMNLR